MDFLVLVLKFIVNLMLETEPLRNPGCDKYRINWDHNDTFPLFLTILPVSWRVYDAHKPSFALHAARATRVPGLYQPGLCYLNNNICWETAWGVQVLVQHITTN